MPNVPADLHYTKDHEWVRIEGAVARVGLTDFAQRQLGDAVYVEQPNIGDEFTASDPFGSVESVKAVSEIYAPVGGRVTELNEELSDSPELLNTDPYGEGWIVAITMANPQEATSSLLTAGEYTRYIEEEGSDS